MAVRFLEVIKPFCAVLPEVEKPQRRVSNSTLVKFFYIFFGTQPVTYYPTQKQTRRYNFIYHGIINYDITHM